MNIKEFFKYSAEILKNTDVEAPVFEAGVMLCHVLKCSRTYLYSHDDLNLNEEQFNVLEHMVDERTRNVPLQYLTGETEFMSLTFTVNPSVLIPRQDTEILVEKCIELVNAAAADENNKDKPECKPAVRILDMCTGSGCIAVSIANYCPNGIVTACDISGDALEIAQANAERLGVKNRLEFRQGNLFEALDGEAGYDLIVSNPPYIETKTMQELQKEVRDFEPHIALDGGMDGLDFYRRITAEAPLYLNHGGHLAFEIGYNQGESVKQLMERDFTDIQVLRDLGGNHRVVYGKIKSGFSRSKAVMHPHPEDF